MSEGEDYIPESTLGLDSETFSEQFPHAVLLVEAPSSASESTEFLTLAGKQQSELAKEAGRLIRIRKRGGNPFAMMITIGRALNNDIHIPGKDISKFHAYLSQVGEGWQITDAGSTNGTFIAGEQLPLRTARPLELGASVILGSTQVTILQGNLLYQHLTLTTG
jgi:FHA domain-containing protein